MCFNSLSFQEYLYTEVNIFLSCDIIEIKNTKNPKKMAVSLKDA